MARQIRIVDPHDGLNLQSDGESSPVRAIHLFPKGSPCMGTNQWLFIKEKNNLTTTVKVPSLEAILSGTTKSPFSLNQFKEHLFDKNCLEPLLFILEVQQYRQDYYDCGRCFEFSPLEVHKRKRLVGSWNAIVTKYIKVGSPFELTGFQRDFEKLKQVTCGAHDIPHPSILDPLYYACKAFVRNGGYVSFVKTQTGTENKGKQLDGAPSISAQSTQSANLNRGSLEISNNSRVRSSPTRPRPVSYPDIRNYDLQQGVRDSRESSADSCSWTDSECLEISANTSKTPHRKPFSSMLSKQWKKGTGWLGNQTDG